MNLKEISVFVDTQVPEDQLCMIYLNEKNLPTKVLVHPKRMDEFAMMINQPNIWESPAVKEALGWPTGPVRITYIQVGNIQNVKIKGIVSV